MTGGVPELFRESYRAAFADYVADRPDLALREAYKLGRDAVRRDLTVLDLATLHHDVLLDALLHATGRNAIEATTRAAEEFFLQSLSALEMVQRADREAREAAEVDQRHMAILRQLSSFLADASLAVDAEESLEEVLQLVAEHAREILCAGTCAVTVSTPPLEARCGDEMAGDASLVVALTTLDGRELGTIEATRQDGPFSPLDEATLVHLAQTASAAIERTQLYVARERARR